MNVMRLKTLFIAIPFCAATLMSAAQKGIVGRIDSLLEVRQKRSAARYDTAYIAKPEQRWTVKLRANMSGTDLNADGVMSGEPFRTKLEAEAKATVGASVSYRGLSLSLMLNPAKLSGRDRDYEFNFTSYGRRFGFDFTFTQAKTFSGTMTSGGTDTDIASGQVGMTTYQGNAYYVFNHRRFSFPAAFTQSQVQRRSCGSWLLGLSAFSGRVDAAGGVMTEEAARMSMFGVSIGAGYAYNFVVGRRWLLHLSTTPQYLVVSRNRLTVDGERRKAPFKFFSSVNVVGRLAAVYNFGNKFVGMTAVVNVLRQGDDDILLTESVKWRARLFYGFRF